MFFSVVIPTYPPHFKFLKNTLKNIIDSVKFSELVGEIIIACSEVDNIESFKSNLIENDKIIINNVNIKCNASENRNRGWNIAKGKYIAFMDADDSYDLNRFQIMYDIFEKYNCDALIHGFIYFTKYRYTPYIQKQDNNNYLLVNSKTLFKKTFPDGKWKNFDTNFHIKQPGLTNIACKAAYGHATIKKDIEIRYNETFDQGEDAIILREIMYKNKDNGVMFCNKVLSSVNQIFNY